MAVFTGDLADADFFNAYVPLLEDPAYDHGADDLVDLSGVTHMGVTTDGLRQLIDALSVADGMGFSPRVAIVAPSKTVYGVSRMYQMMRRDDGSEDIQLFRDLTEATTWLENGREEVGGDGNRSALGEVAK